MAKNWEFCAGLCSTTQKLKTGIAQPFLTDLADFWYGDSLWNESQGDITKIEKLKFKVWFIKYPYFWVVSQSFLGAQRTTSA